MNRYLAFFGDNYYPDGGMGDFIGSYKTLNNAKDAIALKEMISSKISSWGHVYDTVSKEIVYKK